MPPRLHSDDGPESSRMSFGDHLEELRRRLFRSVIFTSLVVALCLALQDSIFEFITAPYRSAVDAARAAGKSLNYQFLSVAPAESFMGYMSVAIYAGLFFASPFILWQLWMFVSAGLYKSERRSFLIFAPVSLGLFVAGMAFGYVVLIPWALSFLLSYADTRFVSSGSALSPYLQFFLQMTVVLGAVFELPLVMMFLSRIGLIEPKTYASNRRLAIVIVVVVAAIITPPDAVSQILVAVPLYVLFEAGILLARMKA